MTRDFEHFPAEYFKPGEWEPSPKVRRTYEGSLEQEYRRFVWEEDAHLSDRPIGHYEYEWRGFMTEPRPLGALTEDQKFELHRKWARIPAFPEHGKMYWFIIKGGCHLEGHPASHFTFDSDHRWYFDNYFFAFAYSLRMKEKENA